MTKNYEDDENCLFSII